MHQRISAAPVAGDVPFERAELLGEGDLLCLVERLVAEGEDMVAHECVIDRAQGLRVEALTQIEANDLGGKQWSKWVHAVADRFLPRSDAHVALPDLSRILVEPRQLANPALEGLTCVSESKERIDNSVMFMIYSISALGVRPHMRAISARQSKQAEIVAKAAALFTAIVLGTTPAWGCAPPVVHPSRPLGPPLFAPIQPRPPLCGATCSAATLAEHARATARYADEG
jgi:hypothetical protein